MKILFVVTDTEIGGVTTAAYNFVFELSKRGHEITFLDFSACKENENLPEKVKQIFLHGRSKYWKLGKADVDKAPFFKKMLLLSLGIFKKLTNKSSLWNKLIFSKLKGNYDVAIAFRQCAPCYSFVLNKVRASQKVGFIHGDIEHMGDISTWQPFMKEFDKIAYVSHAVEKNFIKRYPELKANACTIYNMLDSERIIELSHEQPPVLFDETKTNIVTVSRVENNEKQIDFIPQIAARLKEQGLRDFKWYIVGDGSDLDKNIALSENLGTQDVVEFIGKLENPYTVWKNADIFVLPTKGESFGLVVIESLLLKIPAVVCDYPALGEIFEDDRYGFVAEQRMESVAEKLKTLMTDKETYHRIKSNCNEFYYSNDIAYQQFLEAVEQ